MRKLFNLIRSRRNRMERDLERELEYHLERRVRDLMQSGLNEREASRQAAIELGGVAQVKEEVRDAWLWRWLQDIPRDVRYAVRVLSRNPGFTTMVVLSLALGIGANTTIFTLIHAIMFKMLPVKNPQELVSLRWQVPAGRTPLGSHWMNGEAWDEGGRYVGTAFPYSLYKQVQTRGNGDGMPLSDVMAFAGVGDLRVLARGESSLVRAQIVSANYFSALGITAGIGRTFTESDDQPGANPVCVISDRYWKRSFGGDPSILGQAIVINGVPVTIIGATPPAFLGLQPGSAIDISLPLSTRPPVVPPLDPKVSVFAAADHWWLLVMGRLHPATTEQQATAALDTIFKQTVTDDTPGARATLANIQLAPGGRGLDNLRRKFSRPLFVLMAMVGVVLLIACVNVANLLLARATVRQREIGIRLSIGSSRGRLVRQLLIESLFLALIGGIVGSPIAWWGKTLLVQWISKPGDPMPLSLPPDLQVLGFAAAISFGTGLLFGLVPALRASRADLAPGLSRSAPALQMTGSRWGWGKALVVAQTALSVVLLFGAALFVRTLINLQTLNTGFERNNLLLFGLNASAAGYKGPALNAFYAGVQQRLSTVPGVVSATASLHLPLSGRARGSSIWVPGYIANTEEGDVNVVPVGADFFKTMKIPLLHGRDFTDRDTDRAPKVAIVNEAFVQHYFRDRDPIGQRIGWNPEAKIANIEIIAVAKDAKYNWLRKDAPATVYHPFAQGPISGIHFELRTVGNPKALIPDVRRAVASLDRNIPLFNVKTQTEQIDELLIQERLFAKLSSIFGVLALVLACVGLYGVLSYTVGRRTGEIGIRMALGANRMNIIEMVLREMMRLVAAGLLIGIIVSFVLAYWSMSLIKDLLFGLDAADVTSAAIAVAVMIAACLLAGALPARRASRIDPILAIRYE